MMYQENKRFPDIISEISIALGDIFEQPDMLRFSPDAQIYQLPEFTSFCESVMAGKTYRSLTKNDLNELAKKLFKALDVVMGLVSVGNNQSVGMSMFLVNKISSDLLININHFFSFG